MKKQGRRGLVPSDSTIKYPIFKPDTLQTKPTHPDDVTATEHRNAILQRIAVERERLRRKYRTDLFLFAKEVCGYAEMEREVHGELCKRLMDAYWGQGKYKAEEGEDAEGRKGELRRYLFLLPRGTFKTSIATIAFPLWILMQNDPPTAGTHERQGWDPPRSFNEKMGYNQRILIGSEVEAHSTKFVANIKDHLVRTEQIQKLFGNLSPSKRSEGLWTKYESNVTWRMDYRHKEANLTCTSLDAAINSGHYDVAICDDMISDKQVTTDAQIQQTIEWYRRLLPLMKCPHPSIIIFIGTRWHDKDLYGYFLEDEGNKWEVYKESATRTEEEVAAGKRPYFFPGILGPTQLEDLRTSMRPYLFSCQYENEPIDAADAIFKSEYFSENYFVMPAGEYLEKFLSNLSIFMTIDPATSKEKEGCWRVVTTWGWNHKGVGYLLQLWRAKEVGPEVFIREAFDQYKRWHPLVCGMEQLDTFQFGCDLISEQTGIWPPWQDLKPSKRQKDIRILGLEPLAKVGRIKLQKEPPHGVSGTVFEEEALRFPKGRSKDVLDASAYQVELAFRGKEPDKEAPEPGTEEYLMALSAEVHDKRLERLHIGAHSGDGDDDWYNM